MLYSALQQPDSKPGRYFALFIQFLIIVSLITFSIETLPNLNQALREMLELFEIAIVFIFTLEYVLRIYTSKQKLSYIFSFYGLLTS